MKYCKTKIRLDFVVFFFVLHKLICILPVETVRSDKGPVVKNPCEQKFLQKFICFIF